MIVVDVNVVAYFFIEGEKTPLARELRNVEPRWAVPDMWRHEFLNILASNCLFAKMPMETANRIWEAALTLLKGNEYTVDMARALSLAVEKSIAAYDMEYVALGLALGVQCVTEDRLLRDKFPDTAISMKDFLASRSGPGMVQETPGKYQAGRKKQEGDDLDGIKNFKLNFPRSTTAGRK